MKTNIKLISQSTFLSLGHVLKSVILLQIRKRLMVSDKGHLEWKKMYFKLSRCYPHREEYSDTLHFCSHCHILFWKVVYFSRLCGYEANMLLIVKLHLENKTEKLKYLILIVVSLFLFPGHKPSLHSQQPR